MSQAYMRSTAQAGRGLGRNQGVLYSRPADEDMEYVSVVNKSDRWFIDLFGGRKVKLAPGAKINVMAGVAKHWLGDPALQGSQWGLELDRLRARHGQQYQLISNGLVHSPELGLTSEKYLNPDTDAVAVMYGEFIEELFEDEYDSLNELSNQTPAEVSAAEERQESVRERKKEKIREKIRNKTGHEVPLSEIRLPEEM